MPSGNRCHAAALRNMPYCYFHTRAHRFAAAKPAPRDEPLKLPVLEDRSAIQLALAQVLDALAGKRIDTKQAGLFLYGLQIASHNIARDASLVSTNSVSSLIHTRDGGELAPEKLACDSEDCNSCEERRICIQYRLVRALSGGIHPDDDPGEAEDDDD